MGRPPTALLLLAAALLAAGCGHEDPPPVEGASARVTALTRENARTLDPRETNVGTLVPDLAWEDLRGGSGRLSDLAGKPVVLVVRDVGCPVSQRTSKAIARIEDDYRPRGVAFLYVNMSPHNTPAEILEEAATHGFEGPQVHDREQRIGAALAAVTTTEVFVLDGSRTLVYRGAIDDQVGRGTNFAAASNTWLRDALDQTLARQEVLVPATSAPGCLLGIDAVARETEGSPTYHREVARILRDNCVECHREGGVGPFPLETYAQARGRKAMIALVLEDDVMPPWFAADGTGPWEGDRRLSPEDEETLITWVDSGAPEGDPADAPTAYAYPDGWLIGEPDLVFTMNEPFEVPAEGLVEFRYFEAGPEVPADLWIQRLEVRPEAREVVHHVTVSYRPPADRSGGFRRDLHDVLLPFRSVNEGWIFLFGYLPGKGPHSYPDGMACFLPKGSRLRFDMHYTPNGRAVVDRTSLGVVLAEQPPELVAETRNFWNRDIAIPPMAADVTFTRDYPINHDVHIRTVTPHMHYRGKSMVAELLRPDGTSELLVDLPAWDQGWQFDYTFREPRFAPAGSRVRVTATYDNSPDNPSNPDPGVWVYDGPQTADEMMSFLVEWIRPRMQP